MGSALNKQILLGILTAKFDNCYPKAEVVGSNPIHRASGTHTAIPANGTMTFNHAIFRVLFLIVGVIWQKGQ